MTAQAAFLLVTEVKKLLAAVLAQLPQVSYLLGCGLGQIQQDSVSVHYQAIALIGFSVKLSLELVSRVAWPHLTVGKIYK